MVILSVPPILRSVRRTRLRKTDAAFLAFSREKILLIERNEIGRASDAGGAVVVGVAGRWAGLTHVRSLA
jgi:hypothetical protein